MVTGHHQVIMTNMEIVCNTTDTCIHATGNLCMDNVNVKAADGNTGRFLLLTKGAKLSMRDTSVSGFNIGVNYNINYNYGAAVHAPDGGNDITMDSCVLTNNTARQGAGLYMEGGKLKMINSYMSHNHGDPGYNASIGTSETPDPRYSYGPAAFLYSSTGTILNSTFTDNQASSGGALYFDINNIVAVTNSTFMSNAATFGGGAIEVHASPNITLTNTTFLDNIALQGIDVYCSNENSFIATINISPALPPYNIYNLPNDPCQINNPA